MTQRNKPTILSHTNTVTHMTKISTEIIKSFGQEYSAVTGIQIPKGYAGQYKPNLMQRLVMHRVSTARRVGNWSGTGAGKTLAAILASQYIGAKVTLIIAINNTMLDENSGWAKEIRDSFPDSNIILKQKKNLKLSNTRPNFIILNYETFQLANSVKVFDNIMSQCDIDMVIIDEIHSTKRASKNESNRHQTINYILDQCSKRNPGLAVLGMSATPVVNNLVEGVSLLEMVTGKKYDDLNTRPTTSNALNLYQHFVINGVRSLPNYGIRVTEQQHLIYDNSISKDLHAAKTILEIEQILLRSKLSTITALAKRGTIIYTHFVDGMVNTIADAVRPKGLTVGIYTGDDKTGLDNFKQGTVDVLIASSTISTGVNGLQKISNHMIIACAPWTHAMWIQLIGRLDRQGSIFSDIQIDIPVVELMNPRDGSRWSWDEQRIKRIHYKKSLSDAAVDGILPQGTIQSEEQFKQDAKKALTEWINNIESHGVQTHERQSIDAERPETTTPVITRNYGEFSVMNQRFNTSRSETTHERLSADPGEWHEYHRLYSESRKTWTEIPVEVIAQELAKKPNKVIGDFGCGQRLLGKSITNKVYAFDHIAVDSEVITCDMANTGQSEGIIDVAVFCLSLMGTNWRDYLVEAHRLLKDDGQLRIAETASQWRDIDELTNAIKNVGFEIIGQPHFSYKWVYVRAIKI